MTSSIDWITIVVVIACFFALLTVMVSFFIFLSNKIESLRSALQSARQDLQHEMRDLQGRLYTQERARETPTVIQKPFDS